jgi:predicted ATP-grasp superfamily ATP-dependent carboligase
VNPHVRFDRRPERGSSAILVCAFAGWNDGGEAATTALRYVAGKWSAEPFATIDPEEFLDFQVNRPTVMLEDGESRRLTWPTCEFSSASPRGRDLVLLLAVEPNVRWRAFTSAILDVAREVQVSSILTLGAFLADVPHTRPAPVTAASSDPRLAGRFDILPSTYEGPTGIVGVLHDAANAAGIPSVSLWAAAPHYLPSGTNPRVALGLLRALESIVGVEIDTDDIETAVAIWERQVREAIEDDPALVSYVAQLEEAATATGDIPSGDQLAAEFERYLRERPDGSTP